MFKDYYKILGISQYATMQEIMFAYRTMSIKWHPDRNPDVDVISIMQDLNEAYYMLKDDIKRNRYDQEYNRFIEQRYRKREKEQEQLPKTTSHTSFGSYDYDIQDEELKEDIKVAREYAKELVHEFFKSLKSASRVTKKSIWNSAKGYIYLGVFLMVVGGIVRTCVRTHTNNLNDEDSVVTEKSLQAVKSIKAFRVPDSWKEYVIDSGAFSIAVPNTIELRHEHDLYTRALKSIEMYCNSDVVVFQPKDLSHFSSEALNHYCRIMILHIVGNKGDFLRSDETEKIDSETKSFLRDLVISQRNIYEILEEPTYTWIDIDGIKAIEIKYRRSGSHNNTTACTMYLLFNDDEMVRMIVSYREQEKELWLPDLDNVIKTFKWK